MQLQVEAVSCIEDMSVEILSHPDSDNLGVSAEGNWTSSSSLKM